jgi:hypothetical protein
LDKFIDSDGDGILDPFDNCPFAFNPSQQDTAGSASGDACNCALSGVTTGPDGFACAVAISAPAMPLSCPFALGGPLLGVGSVAARHRRSRKAGREAPR